MGINLGEQFPDFEADSTEGRITFSKWLGDKGWAILFSHPADYTPVCTTELGEVQKNLEEFKKRGVKPIALSVDDVVSHDGWTKDVLDYNGDKTSTKLGFPILADQNRELAIKFGMLDPDEKDSKGMPLTCRAVFIIGPERRLKLSMLYPATTGRNFVEILRVIDSLQLTATKKVATPANWTKGNKCMVVPSLNDEEAKKLFTDFDKKVVPSGKGYLRFTADPSDKK